MKNNLASTCPHLLREWDYEANGSLSPDTVTAGVHIKVWWKCEKGHQWQAMAYSRMKGSGCPYCAGQLPIEGENDLATVHPELLTEWDYDENTNVLPQTVTSGSGKIVSWKCSQGHKWQTSISNRTKGSGCPYCAGNLPISGENDLLTLRPDLVSEWDYSYNIGIQPEKVLPNSGKTVGWICSKCGFKWTAKITNRTNGYNNCPHCDSLAVKYPDVAKEWDFEANTYLKYTPNDISCGSSKKVWWSCSKCGKKWKTAVANRTRGSGCPNCNSQTSFPEQAIYFYVRKCFPDALNRHKIGKTELDIYIPSLSVAIEYDGVFFHKEKSKNEKEKEQVCIDNHIQLYRVREHGLTPTEHSINIFRKDNVSYSDLDICIKEVCKYIGCEYTNIDTQKDEIEIHAQQIHAEKEQSFATLHPHLLNEWNYKKNMGIDPYAVSEYSKIQVWWLCPDCGKEWIASVSMRSRGKKNCSFCNSIAKKNPELLLEWDYHTNEELGITPENVSFSSGVNVWWKCSQGHKWQASIANRNRGTNCPYCAGNLTLIGTNDLKTLRPDLVAEWDYEMNSPLGLSPQSVSISSGKTAYWICKHGHRWQAIIANRTKGRNCPYCAGQKVWKGFNDLASTNPQLASEWDYEANGSLMPTDIVEGSNKKVYWKCPHCHHQWLSSVANRNKHHGCPQCHHKYWNNDQ